MKKPDARSLSEESLNLLRQQAHRLRGDGRTWADIADLIGVHLTTVVKWSWRFDLGVDAVKELRSQRRGRRFGEKRTISLVDKTLLRDEIIGAHPQQMALPFALWSRKAVQESRAAAC